MEMANYIYSILKTELIVLWTWGFNKPVAIKDGLQFNVQGFLFKGKVQVIYEGGSDTFIVRLVNTDGTLHSETTAVYVDCLVSTIDGLVEKNCSDEEYKSMVNAEYSITNK